LNYTPPDLSLPANLQLIYVNPVYLATKRVLDLLISIVLLPVALAVMVVVGAAIKLTSRGPILFHQLRAGQDGEPFRFLKFRSMVAGAEAAVDDVQSLNQTGGPTFKSSKDPRVTRLGRFLRRSSLDELPQIFHVLSGKMSLVGPRPLPLREVRGALLAERVRLKIKPGLTGLWQVSGRSEVPYEKWVELDALYALHRSTLLDLQILLLTVPAVLSARGAY
jgi:lipopolysaccharide/colanic/teichoic acid biosynthesis glycosyltransferase